MNAVVNGEFVVAIVAPGVASNFPGKYLNLNGWLKSLGVKAFFDVSFGAELTIKSYLDHIERNKPAAVIAQPCPALVSFIEIYHPELIQYLAPADSPMLHTIRMVKEYYPEYRNAKTVVISPCWAKKREFDETGMGDYNVTFDSINKYFKSRSITVDQFQQVDYDNSPAERAVLFSTPGGLLRTAERWSDGIRKAARKIEGPEVVYPYLTGLKSAIDDGKAPMLIDCLNCEYGCNGGTATINKHMHPDKLEGYVEERSREMVALHRKNGGQDEKSAKEAIEKMVESRWKPGLYGRSYINRSDNNSVVQPSEAQQKDIFKQMYKFGQDDIYNCNSCGYGTCEGMAKAIYNGLNKPENCYHYLKTKSSMDIDNAAKQLLDNSSSVAESMGAAST
jgi:hypothetical protein